MENKARLSSQKITNWILNVIIVVAVFFLILTAGVMIEEIYSAFGQPYSLRNADYNVQQERYFQMVDPYYHNTIAGFEGNAKEKEYYGVAKYYEAASLYKAYTAAGNTEMADFFLEKMQKAESSMGSWSITKEPIHKQLGIE